MVRPVINLEPYQLEICAKVANKESYKNIASWLEERHQLTIKPRTVRAKCLEWGVSRNRRRTIAAPIAEFIKDQYYSTYNDDREICVEIRRQFQLQVPVEHITAFRLQEGLRRQHRGDLRAPHQQQINQVVDEALERGDVRQFGQCSLQDALRTDGCHASRREVALSLKTLDPQGVLSRTHNLTYRQRRPFFKTNGPNWSWSMDGHMKLQPWGIEIYGCIDTYSRKILWLYVGHSATTQVSVAKQFLKCVRELNRFPRRGRSDRGVETLMPADFAFHLYRQHLLDTKQCTPDNLDTKPLSDQWIFGPSTKNVRIESWWNQLQKRALYPWVLCFRNLSQNGCYTQLECDRAVFLAVFMPIIQDACQRFVIYWNNHNIRKQVDRPNVVPGRPNKLYDFPGPNIPDYSRTPSTRVLDQLDTLVQAYDAEAYITPQTLAWVRTTLANLGLNHAPKGNDFISRERYLEIPNWYKQLLIAARQLQLYEENIDPAIRTLRTMPKPVGGYNYPATAAVVRGWSGEDDTLELMAAVDNLRELHPDVPE